MIFLSNPLCCYYFLFYHYADIFLTTFANNKRGRILWEQDIKREHQSRGSIHYIHSFDLDFNVSSLLLSKGGDC